MQTSNILADFKPDPYDHIQLDEDELEEALRQGREQKHFRLQREAYMRKIMEPIQYKTHTAEELFKAFADNFKVNGPRHENAIKQLCCYFSNDTRFNGSLEKGILIMGKVGNGKTTLMKLFQINQNHGFRVVSMLDVSFDYKAHGEEGVKTYASNFKSHPNQYGKELYGYCFDDLGTEEIPCRHYGESKNIFAEILQVRYNAKESLPFNSMHVTTNLNADDMQTLYGSRTYDRMKEMFNVFAFEHESWR